MVRLIVDSVEIDVPGEMNLLQACEIAGAEIPRFCYHERLSVAGNCRMCLVEVKGAPKPVASCAQQVRDQRPGPNGEPPVILTTSALVRKARAGVMEFLLANHPLDCPICDQGGECDLQDQAMAFGRARTRFDETKRAVEEKHFGPLIKTEMTRCIQCTRCVRFATEVAGVPELGATGRGEDMEITTWLDQVVTSELSGNLIDLCPVGALTSRPYAFNARPWELRKTESVDVMDGLGSAIRVDARGQAVLRILPRINEAVNEEWISDKARFIWDGLARQRLDRPMLRENGRLRPAEWAEALALAAQRLSAPAGSVAAIAGDLANVEGMKALLDLLNSLGIQNRDCRSAGERPGAGPREGYLFNSRLAGVEAMDALLLIGTDPRREAAVLNARIRKAWLSGQLARIAQVGVATDLTYPVEDLGTGPDILEALAAGTHPFFGVLDKARRPGLILGAAATARPDGARILRLAGTIAARAGLVLHANVEDGPWNGFNVLHANAARVGGLDLGFLPGAGGRDRESIVTGAQQGSVETVLLLHCDEIDGKDLGTAFVIYVGSHGDAGASRADLILPAAAFTEQNGLFVNTEGRIQEARRAVFPKGEAREDWAIFRALSAQMGKVLPYDSQGQLRKQLALDHKAFAGAMGDPAFNPEALGELGPVDAIPFAPAPNFWLTNPVARASRTMVECAAGARRSVSQAAE